MRVMKAIGHEDIAERGPANQQQLSSQPERGSTTSRAAPAHPALWWPERSPRIPKTRVVLLEAGGTDEMDLVMDPNRWPMSLGSELDWGFVAEPNANLNGRAIAYSMGRVLGGGSSISVSTWARGHWRCRPSA